MEIKTQNLDHLGIVAGIIDDMQLVEVIDGAVGIHPQQKVSVGEAVKAMILNGLGFVSGPLYLYSQYFEGKATEQLFSAGVTAKVLTDDVLGRALEHLYKFGVSKLFSLVAMQAYEVFGIGGESCHLDSSSFAVSGKYEQSESARSPKVSPLEEAAQLSESKEPPSESAPGDCGEVEGEVIKITHGYSRDHRPDLKQFMVDVMSSGDGGVPLSFNVGDGNQADKTVFAERIQAFREQWDINRWFVSDAALYSEENLRTLQGLPWLTRVPLTLKSAQQTVSELPECVMEETGRKGYRWATVCSFYGGIAQRWVVIESAKRQHSDLKGLNKTIDKAQKQANRSLKALSQHPFNCEADAQQQAEMLAKQWSYHTLTNLKIVPKAHYSKRGRPQPGTQPDSITYHVHGDIVVDTDVVERERRKAGRFILATNVLDIEDACILNALLAQAGSGETSSSANSPALPASTAPPTLDTLSKSPAQLLSLYKEQHHSEQGWRFLKDPLFFTSSVFLKSPRRIMALAMVMTLALMVYTLAQRRLRRALDQTQQTVPNQLGKPTAHPTMRWIFQCFQAIHVLQFEGKTIITNLSDFHRQVLALLGPSCQKYYCSS